MRHRGTGGDVAKDLRLPGDSLIAPGGRWRSVFMPRMPVSRPSILPGRVPHHQEALKFAQASALHQDGRLADAKAAYEAILAVNPRHVEALNQLGILQLQLGDAAAALTVLDLSLRINPDQPGSNNNRGIALTHLSRFEAALADFDIAVSGQIPGARKNRASALVYLFRFDDALAEFGSAINEAPDDPDLYVNRVPAFLVQGRYDDAMASLDRAIALRPDFADAHFHKAGLQLLMGNYLAGWREYEWRWRLSQAEPAQIRSNAPLWLGDVSLKGRTILLHHEQSFEETILASRYIRMVADAGAKVTLRVPPAIVRLTRGVDERVDVIDTNGPVPAVSYHCPLMSLPLAFRTVIGTIPVPGGYLKADLATVAEWSGKLGPRRRPRVGISWSAGLMPGLARIRSMDMADMAGLTACDAEFHALQPVTGCFPDVGIRFPLSVTHDFSDLAAVIENMDLVVAVDSVVAHLAGAMGKPVWVLLPGLPSWQWSAGSASPWYSSARLFRQTRAGDWTDVLKEVADALGAWRAYQA
jgi:Flp pilus assembly protein TadD